MSFKSVGLFLAIVATSFTLKLSQADILATAYFSGQIVRYSQSTGTFSTFAQISPGSDPFPGLSGIYVDNAASRVYATARESNRVYQFDANTGALLNTVQLAANSAPTGITSRNGLIYIANNGGNSVSVFDSSFALQNTINLPDLDPLTAPIESNAPSGLAFSGDNLLISTFAGAGIYSHDITTGTTTSFNLNPVANNQIALTAGGTVVVGSAAFSSGVYLFDSVGNATGAINIDQTVLPPPGLPFQSPDQTSPSGVAIDADGNIIVAALGRTNPFFAMDNFQNNGGLFRFSPNGTLLDTYGVNLTPLSSVAVITAVPEPGTLLMLAAAGAWGVRRIHSRRRSKSLASWTNTSLLKQSGG